MRHVHHDAADLVVFRPDHPDFLRRLFEGHWIWPAIAHEEGDACRHATRLRGEGALLAGQYLVDVLLHRVLHPGHQVRIGKIGDAEGGLLVGAIRYEGVRRIAVHRTGFDACHRFVEGTAAVQTDPADIVRREVRYRI